MLAKITVFCCVMLLMLGFSAGPLQGQRTQRAREKLQEQRSADWPPPATYSRVSLGRALQGVFEKHYQFCGFGAAEGSRDYLPADINKFLGRRDLRTKVEQADLSGGSLLQYIFAADELILPLNTIRFQPDRRLEGAAGNATFFIQPEEQFDAFLLTKNCSGYLKAALDAGIEPPYSAFRTALSTDDRKESTVLAVAGTFVSPLEVALRANDGQTTTLLLQLWQFYRAHPEYIGQAYYLRAFAGVMIKHTAVAEVARQIENEVGININGPLRTRAEAQVGWGRNSKNSFTGTDWETIVYADFDEKYTRQNWYARLPTPTEISAYFARLQPVFQRNSDFPLMTEGAEHRHYLLLEGVPPELARGGWVIEALAGGVYSKLPGLEAKPVQEGGQQGCRFTVTGQPDPTLFAGPLTERPGKANLSYRIRSLQNIKGESLVCYVSDELPTSAHPIAKLGEGRFDLSIKENRRFAFQWQVVLAIEDQENPVDFTQLPYLSDLQLRRGDQTETLDIEVREIIANPQRHEYRITLETRETWPLSVINDNELQRFNLSCKVSLPAQRSAVRMVRPLKGIVSFPRTTPPSPTNPNVGTVPELVPAVGEGGGN